MSTAPGQEEGQGEQETDIIYASVWSSADRVMKIGLAPELPEDLFALIKKVSRTGNTASKFRADTYLGRRRSQAPRA